MATTTQRPRVGDVLPALDLPIGRSDIVAMSIATRDFHPVHHDVDTARALGHPGLFINIMTICGLVASEDRMIPPPAQRAMSERAGSTVVEVAGSHSVYVSHPAEVAALIEQASLGVATG